MVRLMRRLLVVALVGIVAAGVGYYIRQDNKARIQRIYNAQLTPAIQTAVQSALFDATRTAEAPQRQYRLVKLGENEALADVAAKYHTTIEVIRMANRLLSDVEYGSGQTIVVPEGVELLSPPRRFGSPYVAVGGETFEGLAAQFGIPVDILKLDNPVLAVRGIIAGDLVFVAQLI
jgi:LysM repeat protein